MPVRLAAPTEGAQAQQLPGGGGWRVHLLDNVGRGFPRRVAVVPVRLQQRTLQLVRGDKEVDRLKLDDQTPVDWYLTPGEVGRKGSYAFDLMSGSACPLGGTHWLVVMVLNQEDDHLSAAEVAEPLATALQGASLDDWRSGLLPAFATAVPPATDPRGPAPAPPPLHIALCSCQYPHDVLDRMPDGVLDDPALRGPADASLLALADLLSGPQPPRLLIQAGDQVYLDATAGLFDPTVLRDRARRPYALLRGSVGSIELQRALPARVERLIDDHEIADNWEPGDADPDRPQEPLDSGVRAYWELQRLQLKRGQNGEPDPPLPPIWHATPFEGHAFFFADTRTERAPRLARDWTQVDIMKAAQRQALCNWINEHAGRGLRPCFIASPALVLPRPLALVHDAGAGLLCDSWAGYPHSLHALLARLCEQQADNVVFLGGDEHLSALTRIEIRCPARQRLAVAHAVHSSAMYAPYPFANAREADFAVQESFDFEHGGQRYHCTVSTRFPRTGEGFATLRSSLQPDGWVTEVSFHGQAGGTTVTWPLR